MLKGIADKKGDKKMDYGLLTTDSDLSCRPRPRMIRTLLHPPIVICCKNEGRERLTMNCEVGSKRYNSQGEA